MAVKIGDRVMATVGASGVPRPGRVTAVVHTTSQPRTPQYMIWSDGDEHGHSGPCFNVWPVGEA